MNIVATDTVRKIAWRISRAAMLAVVPDASRRCRGLLTAQFKISSGTRRHVPGAGVVIGQTASQGRPAGVQALISADVAVTHPASARIELALRCSVAIAQSVVPVESGSTHPNCDEFPSSTWYQPLSSAAAVVSLWTRHREVGGAAS